MLSPIEIGLIIVGVILVVGILVAAVMGWLPKFLTASANPKGDKWQRFLYWFGQTFGGDGRQ